MTVRKKGFLKLLSITVILCILFVNTFDIGVWGEKNYTVDSVDNSIDPNVEFTPIDSIPHRTNNAAMKSAPVISAAGEGVKGSYAMQIGSMTTTANTVYFQASSTSIIAPSTEYIVEMKIRKKQGSIDSLKIGFFGYNSTGANFSLTLTDSELSDEWQCYRWKHTTKSSTGWKLLDITYTAQNGVILLFDDIKVYPSNDSQKTPVAFQNGLAADATFDKVIEGGSGDNPGGNTSYELVNFDNTVDTMVEFIPIDSIPHRTSNTAMKSAPVISAAGEGVKGSYAMQIGSMTTTSNTVFFQASTASAIAKDTEYVVEMKIRKKQGSIDSLKIGFFGYNSTGANFSLTLSNNEISNEWQCYRWKHTTKSSTGWKFLDITYTAQNGVILLFDDIKVYASNDTEKKLVAFQNGLAADATFDTSIKYEKNYELVDFDNTVDPDIEYKAVDNLLYRTNNPDMKSAPVISAAGEGVKGSYAMQLGTITTTSNSVYFQPASRTAISFNTEYVIEFKVKIKEGKVKILSSGFYENGIGSEASLVIPNSALSTEWQCFRWKHTTNSDATNWKFFEISYTSAEGVVLLFDDIKIYRSDDKTQTLVPFQNGMDANVTFDTKRIKFTTTPVDNTPDTSAKLVPVSFYDWNNVTKTSVTGKFPSGYIFSNDNRNTVRPRLTSIGDGVKGTYAMAIGGQGVKVENGKYQVRFAFPASNTLVSNTEYVFKVKLKKVQGSIDGFKLGFIESGNTPHYSLDIYDSELNTEWTEYSWKYTTDNSCTGPTVWNSIAISYSTSSEAGATIYIDDLIVYEAEKGEDYNIFPQGDFEYIDGGQEKVIFTNTNPTDRTPLFRKSTANNKIGTAIPRVVECNAHTGKYALALGFDDNSACESMYTVSLLATQPGGTYKVSFWVKVQGEVDSAYVGMMDSFQKYKYYQAMYNFNQYEQGKWTKVEFVFNDTSTIQTAKGYRYFIANFIAPAGSGMLIDDVTITDVSFGGDAPNLFEMYSFEKAETKIPDIVWGDRFTYKGE